ncbi:MAG: hypothetical protein ABIJ75_02265 [Actinomycetota bacterium]
MTDTLSLVGIGRIITAETGDRVEITADGNLHLGDGDNVVRLSADDATYRLWSGAAVAGDAAFRVTKAGVLYATGATIAGAITATSGAIGGWTIGATTLTGGGAILAADGNLYLGTGNDIARLSASNATYRLWVGHVTAGSAPFSVTKAGVLYATGATIAGAITATSGSITGTLTLAGSGKLVTAASGQRVELTAADEDRILLYSGHVDENDPAWILPNGGPYGLTWPALSIFAPFETGQDRASFHLWSRYYAQLVGDLHVSGTIWEGDMTGGASGERVYSANNPPPKYLTKVTRNAVQSIPNGTWTAVLWNTETYDTGGWHSTSSNTDRITPTVSVGDILQLKALAAFTANATGVRGIRVNKSGVTIFTNVLDAATGVIGRVPAAVDDVYAATDYYTVEVYQSSGGALDLLAGDGNSHFSATNQ